MSHSNSDSDSNSDSNSNSGSGSGSDCDIYIKTPIIVCGIPKSTGYTFELKEVTVLPAKYVINHIQMYNENKITAHFMKTFIDYPDALLYIRIKPCVTINESLEQLMSELQGEPDDCNITVKISYFKNKSSIASAKEIFESTDLMELWTWYSTPNNGYNTRSRANSSERIKASIAGKLAVDASYEGSYGKKLSVKEINEHLENNLKVIENLLYLN